MLFVRLSCDSAPLTPFFPDAVIQCARPPRKFAAVTPCNPVRMIQCSRVSGSLGGEIAGVIASALFVRRVRCSGSEFLKARIAAQRIEHWIEPEQRRGKRRVFAEWASARY